MSLREKKTGRCKCGKWRWSCPFFSPGKKKFSSRELGEGHGLPGDFLTWKKVTGFKAVSQVLLCSVAVMSCIITNMLLFHSLFWEMMGLEQYTHRSSLPHPSRLFCELLMSCTWLNDGCLPVSGNCLSLGNLE